MKVHDLGASIIEITNCTIPLCTTSWYSVDVYGPELIKHKNNHLVSEYHNVRIYVCTYTMRVDPRFRATTMLMWSTTSYAVARHT